LSTLRAFVLLLGLMILTHAQAHAETYADVKDVIDKNCTRCHNADGVADFLPFDTFNDIKPVIKKMADMIKAGKMPKDDPAFKDSPEGARLIAWLTSGEDLFPPAPPQQGDTYVTMKPLIDQHCASCHNADGIADFLPFQSLAEIKPNSKKMAEALQSGKMPKNNPTLNSTPEGKRILAWLTTGSDLHAPVPQPPAHPILKDPRDLKYEDVKTIIRQNCVGCHNPKGQMPKYPFETFDQVADMASKMFKQLSRRKMPLGNPEFRFTQDGRALLGWLEFGRDLNGSDGGEDR
jgi:uncharacterized membrane protein